VHEHRQEAVDAVGVLAVLGGEIVDRQGEEGAVGQRMAVDDEKGRLCGVRHPASLVSVDDTGSGPLRRQKMTTDTFSADTDGLAWARERGNGALAERMGFEWVELTRERAVATMPVAGNTQPVGLMHGGAFVVLGESLGSMHANYHAGSGRLAVGVDINATHTRSATSGLVTGVCTPVHLGRSMTVHEIVVSDDQGRRCSTIRITNMIKDLPPR